MRVWAFPSIYPIDKPGLKWSGIFAHRQYKGLIENGASLTVIVPLPWYPSYPLSLLHPEWNSQQKSGYPYKRVYDGITVYHPRIANFRPNRFVKKSYTERYVDAIVNFFKDNNITPDPRTDIFFSQWLPVSAYVQLAAHKMGIKSAILSIGDDVIVYPHEKKESFDSFKKTVIEADVRFACADYLGRETNKLIGLDLPYDVIYWGVDHNFFKPAPAADIAVTKKEYNIPDDKIIILTVASPIKRKGWLDLFDALQEVKKVNANFMQVAIGGGPTDFDLNEEAQKRGLSANFLNLKEIDPGLLNRLYNTADIFCLPSHWEGLANVVIEAMSSGLPVITTNVCGHPEIINSGVNGILVPPHEPGILAKEILTLINSKEQRASLGENARSFIVNKWGSFSDNAAKLYEIFEQSLAE